MLRVRSYEHYNRKSALSPLAETAGEGARSYCRRTTLHGYAYAADGDAGIAERAAWLAACLAFLALAGVVVNQAAFEWRENPVVTTIDTFLYPVELVPHPAVAVCAVAERGDSDSAGGNYDPWATVAAKKNLLSEDPAMEEFLESLGTELGTSLSGEHVTCADAVNCALYPTINTLHYVALLLSRAAGEVTSAFRRYFSRMLVDRDKSLADLERFFSVRVDLSASVTVELDGTPAFEDFTGWFASNASWTDLTDCLDVMSWMGRPMDALRQEFVDATGKYGYCFESKSTAPGVAFDRFTDAELGVVDYCVQRGKKSHQSNHSRVLVCMEGGWKEDQFLPYYWCEMRGCNKSAEVAPVKNAAAAFVLSLGVLPRPQDLGKLVRAFGDRHYRGDGGTKDALGFTAQPRELVDLFTLGANATLKVPDDVDLAALARFLRHDLYMSWKESDGDWNDLVAHAAAKSADEFVPVPTDFGLCEVYNADQGHFAKVPHLDDFLQGTTEIAVKNISGSGKAFKRSFWVNVRPRGRGAARCAMDSWYRGECFARRGRAVVAAGCAPADFFAVDAVSEGATTAVTAGTHTVLNLRPVVHSASANLRELDIESRKCRFPEETMEDSILFPGRYTRKSCLYECALSRAALVANCTPWDFPRVGNSGLCTSADGRLSIFYESLRFARSEAACSERCLPDCEEVRFEVDATVRNIKVDEACSLASSSARTIALRNFGRDSDLASWLYGKLADGFVDAYDDYNEVGLDEKDICREEISLNLAKVTVSVPAPNALRVVKSRRFTFADQLGLLGGTMGLFTGFSLVSAVEAAYWLCKTVVSSLKRAFGP